MVLYTKRLIIRDFTYADADDLHKILGDEKTMEYIEPAFDKCKTDAFLRDFCINQKRAFAAQHKENGNVIGYILFSKLDDTDLYEIGWIFNRCFWRQGFAYEACKSLICHAFENMAVNKIIAETTDTVKSFGLIKKLGFTQSCTEKSLSSNTDDLYIFSLTKEDYLK